MVASVVRRADFLMALAYATDLATGHSREFALRSCVLAMRLADVSRLDEPTRRSVYHQALLRYIGCNADTHLLADAWGDEITLRRELHHIDMGNRAEFVEVFVRAITRKFAGASPEELAKEVERGLAQGPQVNVPILSGHCEVAQRIAKRAGGGYEPALADLFLAHAEALVAGLDEPVDRATILALEPEPHGMLSEEAAEEAYLAIADMIDMRMPFTFGHSRAVAELAAA